MAYVRTKDSTLFAKIAPGGFELLRAITEAAKSMTVDIVITSGTDGAHSGPTDPHHRGEAYDIRTHDQPDPQALLDAILAHLDQSKFFAFIEDPGAVNEHIHCQVKKGTTFPPI